MDVEYFKKSLADGEIHLKVRYISPTHQDKCYEVFGLRTNAANEPFEFIDECNAARRWQLEQTYKVSSEEEFIAFQEANFLGIGNRKKLFDEYYKVWKNFYNAKKKALIATRASEHPTDFYVRAYNEELIHNVHGLLDRAKQLTLRVEQENSLSKSDIMREVKHLCSMEYVTDYP